MAENDYTHERRYCYRVEVVMPDGTVLISQPLSKGEAGALQQTLIAAMPKSGVSITELKTQDAQAQLLDAALVLRGNVEKYRSLPGEFQKIAERLRDRAEILENRSRSIADD
jgi:hypothetical protein